MKIVCLGDSLTEGDYGIYKKRGIANVHSENYPYYLGKISGAEVLNYGKCGFRACHFYDFYKTGEVNVSGADIIIIMLGTNGGFDLKNHTEDNNAFCAIVEACRKDEPRAKIVLCTPPHVTINPKKSNFGYSENVANAAEFVADYASKNDCTLIDINKYKLFNSFTEFIMQPNDGVHFSRLGYKLIARYIYMALKPIISDILSSDANNA